MNKPNQTIDEINGVVYPPSEAIEPQLSTIRAIIPSAIKTYLATKDIHTIFPSLDAIQTIIDYLRGKPALEFPDTEQEEEEPEIEVIGPGEIDVAEVSENHYCITVHDYEAEAGVDEELFGSVENVTSMDITFPIICGRPYTIRQTNPALSRYDGDSNISQDADGNWTKVSEYKLDDDDVFTYSFLIPSGRNLITIDVNNGEMVFEVITHVHFKKTV